MRQPIATTTLILTIIVALTPGCARRSALEPPGKADIRLVGGPSMYSSPEGLVWLGRVKNYGYRTGNQVVVTITFTHGIESFGLLDTYDTNLRPYEEAVYEIYSNERSIDKIKVTWQEAGGDGIPACHSYLYEYHDEFLRQMSPKSPCG
ncbi:hypothetical protein ACFLT7_03525 [candidate division KSB1 bacterium]